MFAQQAGLPAYARGALMLDDPTYGAPADSTMLEIGVPAIEPAESEASEADAPIYSEDFRMVPQSDTAANLPAEPEAPDLADSGASRPDQNARPSLVRKVRDWLTRAA
jgi:hypothetical protein